MTLMRDNLGGEVEFVADSLWWHRGVGTSMPTSDGLAA
jgi:hypothetical protein